MGLRLFNRTTRSVSLSEAGEKFLARVQPALHRISWQFTDELLADAFVEKFQPTIYGNPNIAIVVGSTIRTWM